MKLSAQKKRDNIIGYSFIAPAVIIYLVFTLLPIVLSVVLSFTNYSGYNLNNIRFVGLRNYDYLFLNDEYFLESLWNILIYMTIIPINMVISIGIALLIGKTSKTNNVFRVLYYIPVLTSAIATATVWKYILDPNIGMLNVMLNSMNLPNITLMNRSTAKLAIMMVTIWMGIGGNMVLYIAALKGLPIHLYEAAQLEGANKWQMFRAITLPLLKPVTYFVLTMQLISVPQIFDQILVLTGTNSIPLGTQSPVFMIYQNINETGGSASLAVAESTILFIGIIAVTFIMQRLKKEQY